MKKLLLVLFFLLPQLSFSQAPIKEKLGEPHYGVFPFLDTCNPRIDVKAISVYDSNLSIIKNIVLRIKDYDKSLDSIFLFFVKLTGIAPDAKKTVAGGIIPSINDYKNWTTWFLNNLEKLYWEDKKQEVKVKTKEQEIK